MKQVLTFFNHNISSYEYFLCGKFFIAYAPDTMCEKVLRMSWEGPGKVLGKSWEIPEKGLGECLENHKNFWESLEKVQESPEKDLKNSKKCLKKFEKILRKPWEITAYSGPFMPIQAKSVSSNLL